MRAFHIERRATYPMNPCPMPGDGVHRWLLGEANSMVARGYSREEIGEALKQLITRKPQKGEIEAAVEKALRDRGRFSQRASVGKALAPSLPSPRKEKLDEGLLAEAVKSGFREEDFSQITPFAVEELRTAEVVRALFPPSCLLHCSVEKNYGGKTCTIEEFGDFGHNRFIVPQEMTALEGVTKEGKWSARAESNTGPWRFFVFEVDQRTRDEQAAAIFDLCHHHPLALVVFSGSRSLHAWYFVDGVSSEELNRFQSRAIRLGGCTGTLTRSQLVRMPGAWNKQRKQQQRILFFNPASTER